MAGRRPKPTVIRIAEGNRGKRPINEREPKPISDTIPSLPKTASIEAKEEWKRIAPELQKMGVLTFVDQTALEAYCESYATWKQALAKTREGSLIHMTSKGYIMPNPYLSIANKAARDMLKFMIEFGLTPASRSRLVANASTPDEDMGEFMRRISAAKRKA
jgi:P27 family predicted phage terminase small subunit